MKYCMIERSGNLEVIMVHNFKTPYLRNSVIIMELLITSHLFEFLNNMESLKDIDGR